MTDRFVCYFCPSGKYIRKADRRACARCDVSLCERHCFIRVDESNESITRNSPKYCAGCADILEPHAFSLLP
jgi:hypothetical protein